MSAAGLPESRWQPSPGRLVQLLAGLWIFGAGEALLVASELGNSPWTVLAEGASVQSGLSVGVTTIAISGLVLLAWIPLRQRPGLGTILNGILVGVAIDVTLELVDEPSALAVRVGLVAAGIVLVGIGSRLYLTTYLGPGPRDGLMTGLHRRTGAPIGAIRAAIELTALGAGWALGGTVGIGTLAFALAIGPLVAALLRLGRRDRELTEL